MLHATDLCADKQAPLLVQNECLHRWIFYFGGKSSESVLQEEILTYPLLIRILQNKIILVNQR